MKSKLQFIHLCNCACRKGAIQVDYILAVSIFLVFFALTIQYTTDYFSTVRETADITDLRSEALSLLGIADRGFEPATWPQFANISNELVLLMHLNNDTLDYSGKGNNGVALNGANCSTLVAGRFFTGCGFDGVDDNISIDNSSTLNITGNAMAISLWAKGVAQESFSYLVGKSNNGGTVGYAIYTGSDATLYFFIGNGTAQLTPTFDFTWDDSWRHIAGNYNGSNLSIYVDGVFRTSSAVTGNIEDSGTIGLHIGGRVYPGGSLFFNGTIDEVAIWNRSLSAAEINELYQQPLRRIGLKTEAFRFIAVVNNTKPFLVNTSENATAITLVDELVVFNLSIFGFNDADYNSVMIYNSTNHQMPIMINGSNVTFRTNVTVNTSAQFTVYFDDDSVFPNKSLTITGVDNLTETFHPVERISVLQHEKLRQINESNYTNVRAKADVENNFRITLLDVDTNATIMNFGETVPRSGNIIALQRHVVFQNSTAGIRNGRLTIRTW